VIIVSIDVKAAGHLTATLEIRNGSVLVDTVLLSADAEEPGRGRHSGSGADRLVEAELSSGEKAHG
jgi:hypothetical protein